MTRFLWNNAQTTQNLQGGKKQAGEPAGMKPSESHFGQDVIALGSNALSGVYGGAANVIEVVAKVSEAGGDYLENRFPITSSHLSDKKREKWLRDERQLEPLFKGAEILRQAQRYYWREPTVKWDDVKKIRLTYTRLENLLWNGVSTLSRR